MAKIIGHIPVRELRQRTRRTSKPITVSVGAAFRDALSKRNPEPQGKEVVSESAEP